MNSFGQLLKVLKIGVWVAITLVIFSFLVDLLWVYQMLSDSSPLLAKLYALILLLSVSGIFAFGVHSYRKYPGVMLAPKQAGPNFTGGRLRMARYTSRFIGRLRMNPSLDDASKDGLDVANQILVTHIAARVESDDLEQAQLNAELVIEDALKQCDNIAEKTVRNATRDVMITVTLSPWRALDLILVLWRNLRMISSIIGTYNARPRLREQIRVYRDVFLVVITVNFLNIGSSLLQNLAKSLPLLGRFAGDIAQGVGAGLMTSVAGHSAIARCRAFGVWDEEKEMADIGRQLSKFGSDVTKMVFVDVFPKIQSPIEAKYATESAEVEIGRIQQGIKSALDETFGVMDSFVVRPTRAVGRGAINAGAAVGSYTASGTRNTLSYTKRTLNSAATASTQSIVNGSKWLGVGTKRAFSSSGRRIKNVFSRTKND
jgi:hypothetical protein